MANHAERRRRNADGNENRPREENRWWQGLSRRADPPLDRSHLEPGRIGDGSVDRDPARPLQGRSRPACGLSRAQLLLDRDPGVVDPLGGGRLWAGRWRSHRFSDGQSPSTLSGGSGRWTFRRCQSWRWRSSCRGSSIWSVGVCLATTNRMRSQRMSPSGPAVSER
jgi:hypothetical protein